MALTGNANVVIQTLNDNALRYTAKLLYHTANGTQESDALKVNVATLTGKVFSIDTNTVVVGYGFAPGETVTGETSNATAVVLDWSGGNILRLVNATGIFEAGENIIAGRFNTTIVANSINIGTYRTAIRGLIWDIHTVGAKVELAWGNSSAKVAAMTLSGQGSIGGKYQFPTIITNDVPATDGNLYLSTFGLAANSGYTLIVELSKGEGFGQPPIH